MENEKKTCSNTFHIGINVRGSDESECRRRCDYNGECMFYFYSSNKWCVLYSSCDEKRTTGAPGKTLKKEVNGTLYINSIQKYSCPTR